MRGRTGFIIAAILAVVSLVTLGYASTSLSNNPRTLVVLDNHITKTTHSMFFNELQHSGHKVEFINVKEEPLVLSLHGKWLFDNLIIFAPTLQDFGEFLRPKDIMQFVDAGNSLLLAGDARMSEPLRELANGYGVDFDEETSRLVDGEHDVTSTQQVANILAQTTPGSAGREIVSQNGNVIMINLPCDASAPTAIIGACTGNRKLYYSGIGSLVPEGSKFVRSVISGNPTTVSLDKGAMTASAQSVTLVAASQSLINARAAFVGSLAMFSDSFFQLPNSANREVALSLTRWVFHESGYVRVRDVQHAPVSTTPSVHGYKVGDEITYEATLESFDPATKSWKPFVSDRVLFEVVMVDPFYRYPFNHVGNGKYSTQLKLPDTFGNYKLRTKLDQFDASGVAYIENDTLVPVRPYRQEEYERFILVASPYYVNAFSVMSAFVIFCYFFLYTK